MIMVLTGQNAFARQRELQARVAAFVQAHGDMAVEQHEASDLEFAQLVEALQGMSLFAPERLVVLHEPSQQKQFLTDYEQVLAGVAEGTDVILVESQLDKRTAYYKWLKKHTNLQDFTPLDERALARFAVQFAAEQQVTLRSADAEYLIHRVGTNQQRVANEVTKLILATEQATITRALIDEQTEPTPQSKIFDLLDAVFAGQSARAAQLYDEQRQLKVEPQEIAAMIGWQLRQVAVVKAADAGRHDPAQAGVSPFSAGKARRIARSLSFAQLKQCVAELAALDMRSKSASIDFDEALQVYLLQVSRRIAN